MAKIFRVMCGYYIKANNFEEVEKYVAEEAGLDFYERHIILDEIREEEMPNKNVDIDLT